MEQLKTEMKEMKEGQARAENQIKEVKEDVLVRIEAQMKRIEALLIGKN